MAGPIQEQQDAARTATRAAHQLDDVELSGPEAARQASAPAGRWGCCCVWAQPRAPAAHLPRGPAAPPFPSLSLATPPSSPTRERFPTASNKPRGVREEARGPGQAPASPPSPHTAALLTAPTPPSFAPSAPLLPRNSLDGDASMVRPFQLEQSHHGGAAGEGEERSSAALPLNSSPANKKGLKRQALSNKSTKEQADEHPDHTTDRLAEGITQIKQELLRRTEHLIREGIADIEYLSELHNMGISIGMGSSEPFMKDLEDMQWMARVPRERVLLSPKISKAVAYVEVDGPPFMSFHDHQYDAIKVIGEGAYGTVFKSRHRETRQVVALKQFKMDPQDRDAKEVQRTSKREVDLLSKLRNQHIVRYLAQFWEHGKLHMVMEYVPRTLLEILLAHPWGLPDHTVRQCMFQLCCAITFIHKQGILYRDFKPENVLVDNEGVLKICDFGFARRWERVCQEQRLTEYVATRWYRAPELLLGPAFETSDGNRVRSKYGESVDSWSLGCILAELTDGVPCFPGKTDIDQIVKINEAAGLTAEQIERFTANPWHKSLNFGLASSSSFKRDQQLQQADRSSIGSDDARGASRVSRSSEGDLMSLVTGNPAPNRGRLPVQAEDLFSDMLERPPSPSLQRQDNQIDDQANDAIDFCKHSRRYPLDARYGKKLDEAGVDLLVRMLAPDPQARLTPDLCLRHPYFHSLLHVDDPAHAPPIPPSIPQKK